MKKKSRTKREFKGKTWVFLVLLCFGIVPALFYYWYESEEIEVIEEVEE